MAEILSQILDHPAKTVLTLHRKPDGDSIGSNLALYRTLHERGHDVTIFSKDPVSPKFSFLPNIDLIQTRPPSEIPWDDYDRYIALDMGGPEMLGEKVHFPENLEIITIDHHYTNEGWGGQNIINSEAISASSVLLDELQSSAVEFDKDTATALLTGISTDSGFFIFSENANPFDQASILIKNGAEFGKIVDSILNHIPPEDISFISKSLANQTIEEFSPGKKAVILPVDHDLWTREGISQDKNVYLLYYIPKIEGTEFGVLLIEEKPGEIRVELRSRNQNFDVSELALKFGGGGHKKAAGARINNLTLTQAKEKILSAV